MSKLYIPENYSPLLDTKETEHAIVMIKDFFQTALSTELNLRRVTAPLFLPAGTGFNDDLNGVEVPVNFNVKDMGGVKLEIVQSLAKWKRYKVTELGLMPDFGIYTDMNAIRPDEELDNTHSLYVDQWDWEMCIDENDRTVMHLKEIVEKIYRCLKRLEFYIYDRYDFIKPFLPQKITFVFADELQRQYPDLTPKERENKICQQYGAVFLIGIGGKLDDGSIHDGRAPDYDDWITETGDGHRGLNGDLLVWYPVLNRSVELSSMGIRVDADALCRQLEMQGCEERKNLYFHRRLLDGSLPLSIGGGIGQSRLCTILLHKAHVGETQASIWPEEMRAECKAAKIALI